MREIYLLGSFLRYELFELLSLLERALVRKYYDGELA